MISPDSPMMSAPSAFALARISEHGTITPMLTTSKLLHWRTTVTMFLPMSCTSPLTVAMTILPFAFASPPAATCAAFSSSMNGIRCATACFITRALFTTCGRNILPAPNRSPTTFMPSISGPSMTSIGRPPRAAIVCAHLFGVLDDPLRDAVHERMREPRLDRLRRATRGSPPRACRRPSASRRSRSSARSRRVDDSARRPRRVRFSSGSRSSYTPIMPALTMPIVRPARIA